MISLIAQYVSDDFVEVGENFDRLEIGNVTNAEFLDYLEKFVAIPMDPNSDFTPNIRVTSPKGVFNIEAGVDKLYLSDTSDPNLSSIESTPGEALFIITGLEVTPADQTSGQPSSKSFQKTFLYPCLVLVIVAGSVAAIGHKLLTPTDPLFPPVTIPLINDGAKIVDLENEYAGTYYTGRKEGDRLITISNGGVVDFFEVSYSPDDQKYSLVKRASRNYVFGSEGGGFFAIADKVHVITLLSPDVIEYYDGRYNRVSGTAESLFK